MFLIIAVAVFAAVHLSTAFAEFKPAFKKRFGAKSFGPAFGVASLLSLVLIVLAWRASGIVAVYEPASWGKIANFIFTLIGFLFLGIFLFRGSWRNALRFPMGIAVGFWAIGHLLANGDLRSITLFGGLLIYAVLHVLLMARRGMPAAFPVREGHNLLSMFAGLALYGLMAQLHGVLIGVPVFQLTP
jgi:uncharacterized membrane protein